MAKIRPFKAIRPTRDKASLVATRSYLSYSNEMIKEKLTHNPYTFLHIIKPEHNQKVKISEVNRLKLTKNRFNQFIKKGILKKDKTATYYIYQQSNKFNTFTGIIASTSIEDYVNNKIKKHEHTLPKREGIFCKYLDIVGFNADPVLLSHEPNDKIKNILKKYVDSRPEYEFTTTNKSLHKLWLANDNKDIIAITNTFKEIENLYIADGHHRCASSALLSEKRTSDASNYFMSYLIEESQLNILSFNRLVKNLNGLTNVEFLKIIKERYIVNKKKEDIYSPSEKNEISMYLGKSWYSVILNKKKDTSVSGNLDPSILSNYILKPILNIVDERTDNNISFLDGRQSLYEIKKRIDNNEYVVAFILKPIPVSLIKDVADNNEILPPKSTYVEPKLRSGLTIYPID